MEFWNSDSPSNPINPCYAVMTQKVANISIHMLGFFFIVILCNALHFLLRPASQPRIISESIVGLLVSIISPITIHMNKEILETLSYMVDFGMICHMFVVGLEMDPNFFLQIPSREAKVATSSYLVTVVLSFFLVPLFRIPHNSSLAFNIGASVVLSGTSSQVLTRMITDLKIAKSDIGKFVVSSGVHSDIICTILLSIGFIIFTPSLGFRHGNAKAICLMIGTLFVECIIGKKVTPLLMNWVNLENPPGKPMKGPHLVLSIAYVFVVCSFSPTISGYHQILSAFLAGLTMPRKGRISKLMISKVNNFFSTIFSPLFFFWVGMELKLSEYKAGKIKGWAIMFCLVLIGSVGKVIGSTISGVLLGLHWPESVAIGSILNTKAHFQVYLALQAWRSKLIDTTACISIVIACLLTNIFNPLVVSWIIKRAKKRLPNQRMALQWDDPTSEPCFLLCIHGPQNALSAINLMEISRGSAQPGINIYLTEMIELTDKIAGSLSRTGESEKGVQPVVVNGPQVAEMRQETTNIVQDYLDEAGVGISVQRMLALSTMNNLPQDVCTLAEDLMVSFIILPFHKRQEMDGMLKNEDYSGFRLVNRKILRQAPCSVGILVDRGLGSRRITRTTISLKAAVIFIGGKDDREALAFAGRLARHPGVKLTVIRFLVEIEDTDSTVSSKISKGKINTSAHQQEMKVDDEAFADFYDKHVEGGSVGYIEKYLVNSGQTFSTLRTLETQYTLFIVGRGGRVNSVLTVGMNDWEQCPELGPIGDILSGSEFSTTASVLIIQQHKISGELDGIHDGFSIM